MKNYFKKFSIMFVMSLILVLGSWINVFGADDGVIGTVNLNNTAENSAKVGSTLTVPEKGWKRYDDSDGRVLYNGSEWKAVNFPSSYNGTYHACRTVSTLDTNVYATFKFYGTKLRILGDLNYYRSRNICIAIDGVLYRYDDGDTTRTANATTYNYLKFEITGLSLNSHTVKIYCDSNTIKAAYDNSYFFELEAIDIDANGYLLSPSISINPSSIELNIDDSKILTTTTTPAGIGVTWSSSDSLIANIDKTTGEVKGIKEGVTDITATSTAISGEGNHLNAKCTVNVTKKSEPTKPTEPDNKTGAILIINLTDGGTKVFDVSLDDAAKFKLWYNTKNEYENKLTYEFVKTVNSSISVEENVVHDKITSYEVRKY